MKKIVVITGAGISAESGISTFRDSDGLWENYNVEDVASIEGWYRNPGLMIKFYNDRRSQLETTEPNRAHYCVAEMEKYFKVSVVTQNIDNLHEIAGSSNVIHLHGELTKVCSSVDKNQVYEIGYKPISIGDKADDGSQLRPFIVWFGEAVPLMGNAIREVENADIVIIVGTSMEVYPAAGLICYAKPGTPIYFVDPRPQISASPNLTILAENASTGVDKVLKMILDSEK